LRRWGRTALVAAGLAGFMLAQPVSAPLNMNVVAFTGTSYASLGYNLPASDAAFTKDSPFLEFEEQNAMSWSSVD
jgi:hypothetical protein